MEPLPRPLRDRVRAALASYAAANPLDPSNLEGTGLEIVSTQLCGLWCHGLPNLNDASLDLALEQFDDLVHPELARLCRALRARDHEAIATASRTLFALVDGSDELFDVTTRELPPVPAAPEHRPRLPLGGEGDAMYTAIFSARRVHALLTDAVYHLFENDEGGAKAQSLLESLDESSAALYENPLLTLSGAPALVEAERELGRAFDDRLQGLFARARHRLTVCLHGYGPCFIGDTIDDDDEYEAFDASDDPFHMLRPDSLADELAAAHWAAWQFHDAVEVALGDATEDQMTVESQVERLEKDSGDILAFATSTAAFAIGDTLVAAARWATELTLATSEGDEARSLALLQRIFNALLDLPEHPEWAHHRRKSVQLIFLSVDHVAEAFGIPEEQLRARGVTRTLANIDEEAPSGPPEPDVESAEESEDEGPGEIEGPAFDGKARINDWGAQIVLRHVPGNRGGASLAGFRRLLAKIQRVGCGSISVEAEDYLPDGLWMQAMAEVRLPEVRTFRFSGVDWHSPDLGDMTALFESCPHLQSVDLQGGGKLRRIVAEHLRDLSIWDWSMPTDEDVGETLAHSRFPALRKLALQTQTGGLMTAPQLRALVERAAPNLRELKLDSFLATGALEGLLLADNESLRDVTLNDESLADYLELIARHGVPKTWRCLSLSGPDDPDLGETLAFLERHRSSVAHLDRLEFLYTFDEQSSETAQQRLHAVCPNVVVEDT